VLLPLLESYKRLADSYGDAVVISWLRKAPSVIRAEDEVRRVILLAPAALPFQHNPLHSHTRVLVSRHTIFFLYAIHLSTPHTPSRWNDLEQTGSLTL